MKEPHRLSHSTKWDNPHSPDSSRNSKIKDEPSSPTRPRRQRLRSPIIISDTNTSLPVKRSRLSSPVIIKDENPADFRRGITESRIKAEEGSPHLRRRSPTFDDAEHIRWGSRSEKANNRPRSDKAPVQEPNFQLSGKLAEDTNMFKGVLIKYNEPEDARKPTSLPVLHIHRQSGYLIGRDRNIADIPMDHPSISKQHAVLQFRYGQTRLYVIDLESANGTFLNNKKIEPRRYYERLCCDDGQY
ncbi:Smad nuclear-interacting protein 1 [Sparganum proliferum]